MPLYVLDTDILTLARNDHPAVVARIRAASPGEVAVSLISVEEQLSGWYTLLRRATRPAQIEMAYRELGLTVQALAAFPFLEFTVAAVARYELLVRMKLNVRKNDLRIGAIALEYGAVVVTRNVRDFGRIPGLTVEDWSAPPPTPPPPAAATGS